VPTSTDLIILAREGVYLRDFKKNKNLLGAEFTCLRERDNTDLPGGTNLFWLPSPSRINLEEPISSGYPAHLGLTWRDQFLLITQPT
jgi:hypothetical protein